MVNIVRNFIDHVTYVYETTSKRAIKKTVETTGDLIGNKIADKITRSSTNSPQNKSETNEELFRQKYISLELRQKVIDDLRLKED